MSQEIVVPMWVRLSQIGIGSLAIILSILAVVIPNIGPFMAIALVAVTLSIVGIENIITGIATPSLSKKSRIISIGLGLVILGFGIFTISNPEASVKFMIFIIAIALLINGAVRIIHSRSKNEKNKNQKFQLIAGIISIVLGIFVLAAPEIGFYILVIVIVIALIIQGIELIIGGIRGKRMSIFKK